MEHKALGELRHVADVHAGNDSLLSRRARLERWAEVLLRDPRRRLKTLQELELVPRAERGDLRADNSPLTVAFEDPVLRAAGLRSDKLGDAMDFFDLSEWQAHRLLCSCLNGVYMEAASPARKLHRMATTGRPVRSLMRALGAWLRGAPLVAHS